MFRRINDGEISVPAQKKIFSGNPIDHFSKFFSTFGRTKKAFRSPNLASNDRNIIRLCLKSRAFFENTDSGRFWSSMARQDNGISAEALMSFGENDLQNVEPKQDNGSTSNTGSLQKTSHVKKDHPPSAKPMENCSQQMNGFEFYSKQLF